ncbi:starch synthase 1, chloroplastic/amyloplastic-like [Phalaenopsis equestris]|uniref:starch synthase 1, chloroplastic/amyloplastic-like n=1 Tax=Phalaenopsis equestris TaxID=78828 RepID=UPI0009E53C92|nr:starch synthase 1, chloroplastic/amyloplastic-like [Phalaenopsis equestris]
MEALRPFYTAQFSVALSLSSPAVRRRRTVRAAAGFSSKRLPCLQPMKCVLEKKKEKRLLQVKETDEPGSPEVYIPCATEKAGIATETFATIEQEEQEDNNKEKKLLTNVQRNIIFVTSEAAPYSKTGGLADVCGSLPIALAARFHRVMVVSPRYLNGTSDEKYSAAFDTGVRIKVSCFGGQPEVAFFHEYRAGVDWVFVDHPSYHRPGNPYSDENGSFGDNQFRFTVLCHAACEAPLVLPLGGYTYGQNCLFLVNDWHAGLVPILLASKYRPHGVYKFARSILVIHNLAHQGVEPAATYPNLGLPPEWYGAVEWVFPTWARTHALDKGETVNILKGAIVTADRIVTVSQGYAWEITTSEGGCGLEGLLSNRKTVLNGITNGVDVAEWDPAFDKHIPFHYSVDNLSGKAKCKAALQKELGFAIRPECPLIGFIGRLDYQKGTDLIMMAIPELLQHDVQFVMLGSGDRRTENWMRSTESSFKEKFRGWVGFNVPVSHRITAGCDMLLMPSRFEPCGLNQLYAMRYGTVPIVHKTGGLRDTVENFDPYADEGNGRGTGWAFTPLTTESMLNALRLAITTFRQHKASWEGLMKRGMSRDSTWENAALKYEQVFEWAFMDPPYVK